MLEDLRLGRVKPLNLYKVRWDGGWAGVAPPGPSSDTSAQDIKRRAFSSVVKCYLHG